MNRSRYVAPIVKSTDHRPDSSTTQVSPRPDRRRWLLLAGVAAVLFFTRLGASPLWDRDEPRNARCAVEMLDRGDWIVPTFNGQLRTHKPVLLYWLMIPCFAVGGVSEATARFPSAVLSIATVLSTYWIGLSLWNHRAAWWGAIALASCLLFVVEARAATPDAALVCFVTLALACYVHRLGSGEGPIRWQVSELRQPSGSQTLGGWPHAAMYLAIALAVLAKGPVGLVLPIAVLVLTHLAASLRYRFDSGETTRSDASWLVTWTTLIARILGQLRVLRGLLLLVCVAGPWYMAVTWQTEGQWLREFLVTHNLARAMEPMEGHGGGIWFYPMTLFVGFFPWSIFALPIALYVIRIWRDRSQRPAVGFLMAWLFVYLATFTVAGTKLPNYLLPVYPALALLTGRYLADWEEIRRRDGATSRWTDRALAVALAVTLVLGVSLSYAQWYLLGQRPLAWVALMPLGLAALFARRHVLLGRIVQGRRAAGRSIAADRPIARTVHRARGQPPSVVGQPRA